MSDSEKPTLLIVDGHSLAYRAFFALPVDSFRTRGGQHTNAIHGFLAMLINLIKAEKPTHMAVAFDMSRQSFRTREYPEYKGTRNETPVEFKGQIPLLQEALAAMNIVTLQKEDFEADDILATLASQGEAAGYEVLVVSGDRDTIQLVNEDVTLLYPSVQGVSQLKRYDPEAVFEKYGVRPEQYPEIAALVGETSDNLPGIPKVGEKTAVKWINQFGSLEEILARADEIKGVVGANLREYRENAERNRRLNRLLTDVELPVTPADLVVKPMNAAEVRDIFARLEFRQLLQRVLDLEGIDAASVEGAAGAASISAPKVQGLLDEELEAWLARASAGSPAGISVDVRVLEGRPVSVGLATLSEAAELPWTIGSADAAPFEAWLASDAPKIFHDAKPQVRAIRRAGVEIRGLAFDTLIAGWLRNPSLPDKSLADLVDRFLGETLPQGDPNQLVPETEDASPALHAWFARRVADELRAELDEGSLRVLTEIEMPTLMVLAEMELAGVTVSHEQLSTFSAELAERSADLASRAYELIGREVNLGSPKQLQESNPHPFLDLLLQHREATKLRQIIEGLDSAIGPDKRVHTTYVQTGSTTGRISSTDPNLQNIPVRAEESRRIRSAFQVGEGYETLLTADYSQIEMRIMAHLSGDEGLIAAFNSGEDLHRFVGAQVFGVEPSDVTPAMRTKVKAMSYGLVYGLSAFGLAKQLRIDQSEAKSLMTGYFERFGAVRDYLRASVMQAKDDGYTTTIFGRRRPFPDINSTNRVQRENAERAALNAPIQGSAADIMKIALCNISSDLSDAGLQSRVLMQIHDELVVEIAAGEWDATERIVRERMGDAATLSVPLDVQVGRGRDWNEAGH